MGLVDQIRGYASDIDGSQQPVTADEVAARIDAVRELPLIAEEPRSTRGVWTVVAVAALVALLLAVPLLVSRTSSDTPPATDAPEVSTTINSVTSTTALTEDTRPEAGPTEPAPPQTAPIVVPPGPAPTS